jgi:hypothetical protein
MHDLGQPQRGNLIDLCQCRRNFLITRILEPPPKSLQDSLPVIEPRADDEGKTEPVEIRGVELVELSRLLIGEAIEAGALLLLRRFARELTGARQAAGQIGMGLDEGESLLR